MDASESHTGSVCTLACARYKRIRPCDVTQFVQIPSISRVIFVSTHLFPHQTTRESNTWTSYLPDASVNFTCGRVDVYVKRQWRARAGSRRGNSPLKCLRGAILCSPLEICPALSGGLPEVLSLNWGLQDPASGGGLLQRQMWICLSRYSLCFIFTPAFSKATSTNSGQLQTNAASVDGTVMFLQWVSLYRSKDSWIANTRSYKKLIGRK